MPGTKPYPQELRERAVRMVADSGLRRLLTTLLRSGLKPDSPQRRQLAQLLPMIETGYLDRWHEAVNSGRRPSAERLARAVATHLLDNGHSSGELYRWVRALVKEPGATLGDLLESACDRARRPDAEYEVLVPFRSVPDYQRLAAHLPEWRSAAQTAAWFSANNIAAEPRQYGAFAFTIWAKDATAASRAAGTRVRRLQARAAYARGETGSRLEPIGLAWIAGHDPLPVTAPGRGVDVLSLVREKTLYSTSGNDQLDDALEMAAPLNAGPPAPTVAGGWSAIESLLSQAADTGLDRPGRVVATDRLAAIVTCSWPRAELTSLSYRHQPPTPDSLSETLSKTNKRRDRCHAVAAALAEGVTLAADAPGDVAAAKRMAAVLANPRQQLGDVRAVFESVLRRLYRQRNIVVHGGTTGSVAMEATLRTAAPLVGAGLDRLAHAKLVTDVGPLELAARAANALELVGDDIGPSVVTMPERPLLS